MFRRTIASAAFVASILVPSGSALAAPVPLYPALDCWEQVGETEVRLHFGVTSLLTVETLPDTNVFNVGLDTLTTPATFAPGYSPRVFSVTVPTTADPVTWLLGQPDYVAFVDPGSLDTDDRCSSEAGVAGPTGPTGLTGPTGPEGPAGESAGQLLTECELVTASIPEGKEFGNELLIACGPDETLMQGGGVCGKGNLRGSYQVDSTTWKVVCRSPRGIEGTALCCPHN